MILTDATKKQSRPKRQLDDSMVPAINIVFLLLIFFMIAGHIEARNADLQIPASSSEGGLVARDIEIQILLNGDHYLNGQKIDKPLLESLQALESSAEPIVISEESIVTCHIDRNLPFSALDPVLSAVRQLKIKRLQIATEHK
ncbi:biopolymer transporter ExbD [Neptuniibacter sp. 1_MG-2023]|uniref:ExbD/TolR family protein n=1 Tax=Neptuniibacter sp. 1_MG-2023 TaxID=3062662 RepID=UPI0026E1757C|nr:biopolymer transporter ExbD [Neptuniibacter sp. 1_MG-2023]MDO6593013.1 biopolymer transporter ExbD [Neptuniibacter sp. 1_MG-2023]